MAAPWLHCMPYWFSFFITPTTQLVALPSPQAVSWGRDCFLEAQFMEKGRVAFSYHSKTPCLAFVNIYKYRFCFALWRVFFFPFLFFRSGVFCGVIFLCVCVSLFTWGCIRYQGRIILLSTFNENWNILTATFYPIEMYVLKLQSKQTR